MKLTLIHGRNDPDEQMEDWGFEGPIIEGIEWMAVTYMTHFRIKVANNEIAEELAKKLGWDMWEDCQLLIKFHDDMIEAEGKYYGDWSIDPEEPK